MDHKIYKVSSLLFFLPVRKLKMRQQQQQQQQQHQQRKKQDPLQHNIVLKGSIVVVAKCPIPGAAARCKTRLVPWLGTDGAVRLARAMLSDIIGTISACRPLQHSGVRKILLYAPPTETGRNVMQEILVECGGGGGGCRNGGGSGDDDDDDDDSWTLMPMLAAAAAPETRRNENGNQHDDDDDLQSSDLGAKLADALIRARQLQQQQQQQQQYQEPAHPLHGTGDGGGGDCLSSLNTTAATCSSSSTTTLFPYYDPVVFLGMDAPELALDEICAALAPDSRTTAVLCPAQDGGYGMLSIPGNVLASSSSSSSLDDDDDDAAAAAATHTAIFASMLWSHPLTAICQIKALTDAGVASIRIGKLMHDVDEPSDVVALARRLLEKEQEATTTTTKVPQQQQQPKVMSCLLHRSSPAAAALGLDTRTTISSSTTCPYTKQALQRLGQWPAATRTATTTENGSGS
jgi:glycosyltransferase A (GT-A) superfamily protein (DUF2064 family)